MEAGSKAGRPVRNGRDQADGAVSCQAIAGAATAWIITWAKA